MKNARSTAIVIFTFVILASQTSLASSVEIFSFTGTISQTSFDPSKHYYESGISPTEGDRFAGTLTYLFDPPIVEYSEYRNATNSTFSRYWEHVKYSYFFKFEEFTIQPSVPKLIDIVNGEVIDSILFKAAEGAAHYTSTGENIDTFGFGFLSSNGKAFDGNGVPKNINSSEFDSAWLSFNFVTGVKYIDSQSPVLHTFYTGQLDTINTHSIQLQVSAPIPEPGTLLLLGTGLVGLVGSRCRRKK